MVFSLSLGIVPLTSYYASLHFIWDGTITILRRAKLLVDSRYSGNSTFAAITAVVAANLVLIVYIVLSILDDRQSHQSPSRIYPPESKKER